MHYTLHHTHYTTLHYLMSKPFDYSKWDNIELSDDEEDCHPNIEKESWFRMKHRSRVEREVSKAKRGPSCSNKRRLTTDTEIQVTQ